MSDVSEVPAPSHSHGNGHAAADDGRAARGNAYDAATIERARALVETTERSLTSIAGEVGVSRTTLREWMHRYGWTRPAGAPLQPTQLKPQARRPRRLTTPPADGRHRRLIGRLYRVYAGQVDLIEARVARSTKDLEEKDARALATLAKTLATLMALERDDGARQKTDPDNVDPDEIRARIARRLYALGQGGE